MSDNPIYSDFWLDKEKYSDYLDPSEENTDEAFSVDLIQLASVRRIISNYVDILTGTSVPVYFKAAGESYNVGGKEIYITTAIRRRKDFDQAVGLALHEAAHTLLTDFNLSKNIPFNAPKGLWAFGRKNNIRKQTLERFLKTMFNIVEDWYIDDWVISRVPGYVGYYEASYNVCFNTPTIDDLLLSKEYRQPSLSSYEFRIINFTNPLTDLQALPGLSDVAAAVDISTISRLEKTKDRIKVAYKVVDIVLKNLQHYHDTYNPQGKRGSASKQSQRINVNDFFGKAPLANDNDAQKSSPGQQEGTPKSSKSDDFSKKSDADRTIQDVADTLGSRPKQPDDENKSMSSQVSKTSDKELPKEITKAVDQQVQYVHGNSTKKELNPLQKNMLDLIESHGIVLVYVPVAMEGNEAAMKVACIVVKKLTMNLITSGQAMFPMANFWKEADGSIQPDPAMMEAVTRGIALGNKLGRRLLIRREIKRTKQIRRRSGTINRRLLYSVGFDAEDIFERIRLHKWSKGSLHITVDASTSMTGDKWNRTMTMCVAICKATSMVDNIHVTVSFRATHRSQGIEMPYIVQAYDSKVDKFSKVRTLFKFLRPTGCTPEGLAFGAIMELFTGADPEEKDRYFLNISDGEPYFCIRSPLTGHTFSYGDGNGVEHTKSQVKKIRRQGVRVLSYYVQDDAYSSPLGDGHNTRRNFQTMYGKDARFIKTNSVVDLATTINELFLKHE